MPPAVESDVELLRAWVDGDRDAGSELLGRHFGSIRRFFANKVSKDEVDDLVQSTFGGCVEAAARYKGAASFRTYLFAIARRQLYMHLRRCSQRAGRVDPNLGVSSVLELGQSPSSIVASAQKEDLIANALQRISVEHQVILELHYWEGMAAPQIAEVLELQPGAVRTRLHRARAALHRELERVLGAEAESTDVDRLARALGLRV